MPESFAKRLRFAASFLALHLLMAALCWLVVWSVGSLRLPAPLHIDLWLRVPFSCAVIGTFHMLVSRGFRLPIPWSGILSSAAILVTLM